MKKKGVLIFLLILLTGFVAYSPMRQDKASASESTRSPFVSQLSKMGWYSSNQKILSDELDSYLANAKVNLKENVQALILPHAGYAYSGQTAAYGVKTLTGKKFSRVIVMGPTHRVYMNDFASVSLASAYITPLGSVPLDEEFIDRLVRSPYFRTRPCTDTDEHSVQIEIPLLQKVLGDFKLVPIVVGEISPDAAAEMGRILLDLMDEDTLVVASSDFTHYGPRFNYVPFVDSIENNLNKLDMNAVNIILEKNVPGFYDYITRTGITICGKYPIAILLSMLSDNSKGALLRYDTSGRLTGDWDNSVSYVSLAFTGRWKKRNPDRQTPEKNTLSEKDKNSLLKLARKTLEFYLENRRMPSVEETGISLTAPMKAIRGAFVTLQKNGNLRGCIGEIFPERPLHEAVMDHAIDSALHDPRFPPVTSDELPGLEFEISALTPPHPVSSYNEIVLGKHGMVLSKYGRQAVFLPQVAPEQGWDLATTLSHLSMKAGLLSDDWKENASYLVFEADVFSETEK